MAIANIMGSIVRDAKTLRRKQNRLTNRSEIVFLFRQQKTLLNRQLTLRTRLQTKATQQAIQKSSQRQIDKVSDILDNSIETGTFTVLSSWLAAGFYAGNEGFYANIKARSQKGKTADFKGIPKTDLLRLQMQELRFGTYLWNNPTTRPQMISNKNNGFE